MLDSFAAGENKCGSLEKCDEYSATVHDTYSLQRGFKNLHELFAPAVTLKMQRWNRLQRDLDIPETILLEDLITTPDTKASDFYVILVCKCRL